MEGICTFFTKWKKKKMGYCRYILRNQWHQSSSPKTSISHSLPYSIRELRGGERREDQGLEKTSEGRLAMESGPGRREGEKEREIHPFTLQYIMHHSHHHHQCTEEVHEGNSGCVVLHTLYNVCSRYIVYKGMCVMRGLGLLYTRPSSFNQPMHTSLSLSHFTHLAEVSYTVRILRGWAGLTDVAGWVWVWVCGCECGCATWGYWLHVCVCVSVPRGATDSMHVCALGMVKRTI